MLPLVGTALLLAAVPPAARTVSPPAIVVRVRQDAGEPLPPARLRRIEGHVRAIWRPYADVQLMASGALPVDRADDTLTLVVTDQRLHSAAGDGLGWIEFIDDEPSRTITVSRTEAEALAARSVWGGRPLTAWPPAVFDGFVERALARSIAHEIGHYLLRSKVHARRGLMRAEFLPAELMNPSPASYYLEPEAVDILQRRLNGYQIARGGRAPFAAP
jgi:hypothetical protein